MSNSAPVCNVEWEQQAVDRLHAYLFCVENGGAPPDLPGSQQLISNSLRAMLPGNTRLIVRDLLQGFRAHRGRYILLVEERSPLHARSFRWIAKLVVDDHTNGAGLSEQERAQRLARATEHRQGILDEGRAWNEHVGHHDPVLLPVRLVPAGCSTACDILGVLYADGSQFIGVDRVTNLEEGFRDAVLFGNPTPASILLVFREVYDRLGIRLYRIAGPRNPRVEGFRLEVPRFRDSLEVWGDAVNHHLAEVRRDANSAVKQNGFRDPVDALNFIRERVPTEKGETVVKVPLEAHHLVPTMLGGLAHGDMHARNVLIGRWQFEARWPVVYDYEHMRTGQLIGWDFVKMEMELKVRLYPRLFSNHRVGRSPFFQKVQEFETKLAAATERHAKDEGWPDISEANTPEERLMGLLLGLRRLAARYLGENGRRGSEWVPEYHFLCACYGVWIGRFNTHYYELASAYVAGGVSMARFLWDREPVLSTTVLGTPAELTPDLPGAPLPTHHVPLEFARRWAKAADRQADADGLLRRLMELYPHVREVRAELAALLVQQNRDQEAVELLGLQNLEAPGEELWLCDEETAARIGKVYKKKAEAASDKGDPTAALGEYERAYRWYEYGWRLSGGHYSLVNAATMRLFMARLKKLHNLGQERMDLDIMNDLANKALSRRREWLAALGEQDVAIWHPASEGEFRLLLRDWGGGGRAYLQALQSTAPPCTDTHRGIILSQGVKLLQAWRDLGEEPTGLPAEFVRHLTSYGWK